MTFTYTHFWDAVDAARRFGAAGDTEHCREALQAATRIAGAGGDEEAERRRAVIRSLAGAYGTPLEAVSATAPQDGADGVSLVTACRNRNENLKKALHSWLVCPQVAEIIVVDWTSATPVLEDLRASGFEDPRIRVIRVEDEPRWILSFAFNIGFQSARRARILKADADIVLDPDFFERNVLAPQTFIAGNWRKASADQAYVNGFFYIWRDALLQLGGFNEYITTYGWDDEELYARLLESGLVRKDVASGSISHLPHDNAARTERRDDRADGPALEHLKTQTPYLIRRNRFIANLMPSWNGSRPPARYETLATHDAGAVLRRLADPEAAAPEAVEREAALAAARELIAWRLGDEGYGLTLEAVEKLTAEHSWSDLTVSHVRAALPASRPASGAEGGGFAPPGPRRDQRKLIVDAQHGLGNRLRAIGSAAAVAHAEDRELVIVWREDHHCQCRFDELFDHDGAVLDDYEIAQTAGLVDVVNYMEVEPGASKDAPVAPHRDRDLYFRSAYVMNHPASHWEAENRFLRSLAPAAAITDLLDAVRSPNDVGVHVRMAGGPRFEHLPWESPRNWTPEAHQTVADWRARSHPDRFIARLDALLDEEGVDTVFVAADLPETYARFIERYGNRAACLNRRCNDRSREQLRYALADAILLSRSKRLLGSTWSSFSELAMRLAPERMPVEMSGKDF
ncbi:MAG: glycosyltransferase [Oceanicaulis sp.]